MIAWMQLYQPYLARLSRRTLITWSALVWLAGCGSDATFSGSPGELPPAADADQTAETADAVPEAEPPAPVTITRSFPLARFDDVSLLFDPSYKLLTQRLPLAEAAPATASFTQAERTLESDAFTQGTDGQRVTDQRFSISQSGKLDLLVVVDDSTSMIEEQTNLASKLDPLLSKITNTDWQIAVVTTSNPCLRNNRLIKKTDADQAQAFSSAVLVPLDATVIEKGFPMAIKALKGECNGAVNQWTRAGSSIAVLILSDEDNCGSNTGEGCPGEDGETAQQMVNYLRSIRPAEQARVYGIFEGPFNACGAAAYEGRKYKEAVDLTGGAWGSICAANYTTTLENISANVSRIVKREFRLDHVPDSGSVVLAVDGQPVTDYVVNGDTITLNTVSPDELTLSVSYIYGATPKYTRFHLSAVPDASTLAVTVNGAAAAPGAFSFDDQTGELVFAAMPLDNARIVAGYRHDGPLPDVFALGSTDVLGAPLDVKVNGTVSTAYTYDAATAAVTFAPAPRDGAQIAVRYRTASGRITTYPAAPADAGDAKTISAVDAATGDAVAVTLENGNLLVPIDEVVAGRMLKISYDYGYAPEDLKLTLANAPWDDEVTITPPADSPEIAACAASATRDGAAIAFDAAVCAAQGAASRIAVEYRYLAATGDHFAVGIDIGTDALWKVTIDGEEVKGFTVEGDVVTIPAAALPSEGLDGAVLTIAVTYTPKA
jgi:hypothetical protein